MGSVKCRKCELFLKKVVVFFKWKFGSGPKTAAVMSGPILGPIKGLLTGPSGEALAGVGGAGNDVAGQTHSQRTHVALVAVQRFH